MKKIFLTLCILQLAFYTFAQSNPRGVKREKEECEQLALEQNSNPRASGYGISSSESIAFNQAKLQARNELAAQVAAEIVSVMQHKAEQFSMTASANTNFNANRGEWSGNVKGNENSPQSISAVIEQGYQEILQIVNQILTNTKAICQNIYDQTDGSVKVYVCLEMSIKEQFQCVKQLEEQGLLEVDVDQDGNNDIDFDEKEFLIELAKAREEYNAKKAAE
ncbi:hypothetical protein FACS1894178_7660 [Bacteroidia bacterium]|nr:hypothetical protein FACS1894178_7660 [Bacteroidia bacterium]